MRFRMGPRIFSVLSVFVAITVISEFAPVNSLRLPLPFRANSRSQGQRLPQHLLRRMGPQRPEGPNSVEDEESDEDENESQARVEPQVTYLNRDQCLAKLLCGMSVPVTGGGASKNGYYSEYANVVAKFFAAFPLEEEEKSAETESFEAYDDYSVEQDDKAKPSRMNSKLKNVDDNKSSNSDSPPAPVSGGLKLFDLATIKEAIAQNSSNKIEDDERNARQMRSIVHKVARARKVVSKLGDKLNTVRQCQQIGGCPFTFKQLRSKLKAGPSVTSNVPLTESFPSISTNQAEAKPIPNGNSDPVIPNYTYNTNSYRPLQKARPKKPASTELSLGNPVVLNQNHKGNDDELEEYLGSPPIFGANGRPTTHDKLRPSQEIQKLQSVDVEYIPYKPPVRRGSGSKAKVTLGSPFPKRVVGYKLPSYIKRPSSSGENDEFDDVNQSTGPIALIGGDDKQQQGQGQQTQYVLQGQFDQDGQTLLVPIAGDRNQQQSTKGAEDDTKNNEDEDDDEDDEDDEDGDEEDGDEEDGDEEDEEDQDQDDEDEEEDEDQEPKKKKKTTTPPIPAENEEKVDTKKKIKKYKNPNPDALLNVFVEEEFPVKKNPEDDEQDHPDNAWTKLAFATSSALIKEPENRIKTELEEKNDEKLNLSKEKDEESAEDDKVEEENSDEEQDEDEEEDEDKSRSQVKKDKKKKSSVTTNQKSVSKSKIETQDDEVDDFKSRNKNRHRSSAKQNKKDKTKLTLNDDEEFDKISENLSKPTSKPRSKNGNKPRSGSKSSSKKAAKNGKNKKSPSNDESEEEVEPISQIFKKPTPSPLLEIGGRPIVPRPEKETKQASKTGALSRFNFNLVRPFGAQTKEEIQAQTYHSQSVPKIKGGPPVYEPSLPSYSSSSLGGSSMKPSGSSASNSFRRESLFGSSSKPSKGDHQTSSSYLPSTSFGSSNNGKVEFLTNPTSSGSSNTPSHYTFPFGSPLSTLKNLFKRPSSSQGLDIPGGVPAAPISAFIHRPAGPESNNYKRIRRPEPSSRSEEVDEDRDTGKRGRGRSGIKKKVPKKNKVKTSSAPH